MNALLRKEIRLQLPLWLTGLALALLPCVVSPFMDYPRITLLLAGPGALALMLSLGAFGREFAHGTFAALLSLPVSRERLWWTKIGVLAAALISLYAAWWFSFSLCAGRWHDLRRAAADMEITTGSTALFLSAAFAGGLWTTMFFRQVAAAIWFAILLPLLCTSVAVAILDRFTSNPGARGVTLAMVVLAYALGGFVLAWRLFLRAEEAHWTGGNVSWGSLLPKARRDGPRDSRAYERRRHGPIFALLRKEIFLQRGTFFILSTFLLCAHLGLILLRRLAPALTHQPILDLLFQTFWSLWLFASFLLSVTAIAEERRLGMLEPQLGQPVHWRWQCLLKFAVVATFGIFCGTVPPCVLEPAATLPNFFPSSNTAWTETYGPWITLTTISGVTVVVGLYASSLSRNTFQALGIGTAILALGGFYMAVLDNPATLLPYSPWGGEIGLLIGWPAAICVALALAAWNFRRLTITRREWNRNIAALTITAIGVVAMVSGIYNRAWEWFQNDDPPHGMAHIRTTDHVVLRHDGLLGARGPNGELRIYVPRFRPRAAFFGHFAVGLLKYETHIHGSNWNDFASSYFDTAAIRNDGTLWISAAPRPTTIRSTAPVTISPPLIQGLPETNWHQIVRDPTANRSFLLLKTDGSLWRWRVTNPPPNSLTGMVAFTAAELRPIQTNSRWSSMMSSGLRVYFTRADGRMLLLNNTVRLSSSLVAKELSDNFSWDFLGVPEGTHWRSLAGMFTYDLGVRQDGTLWTIGDVPWNRHGFLQQLGEASDWVAVAAAHSETAIALKADGSIWQMQSTYQGQRTDRRGPPTFRRLSAQTDWLAVAGLYESFFAVAADGSIWKWDTRGLGISAQLAPSRIPTRIGSLLD